MNCGTLFQVVAFASIKILNLRLPFFQISDLSSSCAGDGRPALLSNQYPNRTESLSPHNATITDAHQDFPVENTLAETLHLDSPQQLMGQLHLKTLLYQGASKKMQKLENENNILIQRMNKMKEGIRIISNQCSYLKQAPLRYEYHPKVFKN